MQKMSDRDAWQEVTIPIREIVLRLGWWLVIVALVLCLPMVLLWGVPDLPAWPWPAVWLGEIARGGALLLLAYVVSVPIHEGLHALGMLVTGTPRSEITFGARILHGVVYVHCGAEMKLTAYRLVLILPVLVTGLLPAVWGLAGGSWWIVAYAYLMIVSAAGDLEMYWRLRKFPGDALTRDHPDLLGCEVLLPESRS